ncbi:catalytic activity protein [[Candida] boidinii]|nr:catalytic activity protein [[Candida] boidinii]
MQGATVLEDLIYSSLTVDYRRYRLLKLANGLTALLISDPTEDLGACAVSVASGAHNDPENIPGLAHLCEHMLFDASKQFPKPAYYFHSLVSRSGGAYNAQTDGERTCYYFEVPTNTKNSYDGSKSSSYFEDTIEAFASYFKEPLFNTANTEKEISAVNNEHNKNCSRPNRIMLHCLRKLANENHPFHRFGTGTVSTLNDIPKLNKINIKKKLFEYFKKYYTADCMSLVVRGPQSLNYLQKLIIRNFSAIPANLEKNSKSISDLSMIRKNISYSEIPVFKNSKNSNNIVFALSESIQPTIRIHFPINDSGNSTSREIMIFKNVWCNLVGDESEGTLFDVLKQQNLITELITGIPDYAYGNGFLKIELGLTVQGLNNLPKLFETVIQYHEMLVQTKLTSKISKYMSQSNFIHMYNFAYEDVSARAMAECRDIAKVLNSDINTIGVNWILNSNIFFNFDDAGFPGDIQESLESKKWWILKAALFQEFLSNAVRSDNMLMTCVCKNSSNLGLTVGETSEDEYFKFNFNCGSYTRNKSIVLDESVISKMSLPKPNIFLSDFKSTQLSLLSQLDTVGKKMKDEIFNNNTKNFSNLDTPKLILDEEGCQLWFKKEFVNIYKGKAYLTLEFVNTYIPASPESTSFADIFTEILNEKLNTQLYPASMINYTWKITASVKGDCRISINVAGPTENLFYITNFILKYFLSLKKHLNELVSKQDFRNARIKIRRKYEKLQSSNSYLIGLLASAAIQDENLWSPETRFECLENITYDDMELYTKEFFSSCVVSGFLNGDVPNFTDENPFTESLALIKELFENNLSVNKDSYHFPSSYVFSSANEYSIYPETSKDDTSSSIFMIFQTGFRSDIYSKTMTELTAHIMHSALTSVLRTEYQLGYLVSIDLRINNETVGIVISVLSLYTTDYLKSVIESVLQKWCSKNISTDELQNKYVKPFSEFYNNGIQSEQVSIARLSFDAINNGANDSVMMKQHKSYWQQITDRTFSFAPNYSGKDKIDLELLKNLSGDEFMKFIRTYISPKSSSRVCINIMANSQVDKLEKDAVGIQQLFKSRNLDISKEKCVELMKKTDGSSFKLAAELFKYFQSQGNGLKLLGLGFGAAVNEIVSVATSRKSWAYIVENSSSKECIKIEQDQVQEFKKTLSIVNNC